MSTIIQTVSIFASISRINSDNLILFATFIVVGYLTTVKLKKLIPLWVATVAGGVAVLIVTIISYLILSDVFFCIFVFLFSGIGVYFGAIGPLYEFRKKGKVASKQLSIARQSNEVDWDEPTLKQRAENVFIQFQSDWSAENINNMHLYLMPKFHTHVTLMLAAMRQMNRRNVRASVEIKDIMLTGVQDGSGLEGDRFDITILANASDSLIENDVPLYENTQDFIETWHFIQYNGMWMLDGITPSTTADANIVKSMQDFAIKNGLFYGPKWGKLLLPKRGKLFTYGGKPYSRITFTTMTRVDNHIIGLWQNMLVQLYTYSYHEGLGISFSKIIGQINLPKSYGGIIIDDKRSKDIKLLYYFKIPKNYKKYSLEWNQFNERYNLYATDEDKYASFELLNPSFMAWLYDHAEHVSIEVVDNVVYIHCPNNASNQQYEYDVMLEILRRSFKELQL